MTSRVLKRLTVKGLRLESGCVAVANEAKDEVINFPPSLVLSTKAFLGQNIAHAWNFFR